VLFFMETLSRLHKPRKSVALDRLGG